MKDAVTRLNNDRYFVRISEIILETCGSDTRIILFGSRSGHVYAHNSDYDIALISDSEGLDRKISIVREKLENSTIPFKVDIINYNSASDNLKKEIEKGIEWNA